MKATSLNQWATKIEPFRRAVDANKRILTVDPSSSCTGVAVHSPDPRELVHADRIRSKPIAAPPYERIDQMVAKVRNVISLYKVEYAVVEVTTGKTSSRHGGHGAGLAIYGVAVGAIRQLLATELGSVHVLDVNENDWTRRTSKLDRWNWCKANYPSYAELWDKDRGKRNEGFDASDATYLYEWCRTMADYTR